MVDRKGKGRKFGRERRGSEGNVEEWLKRKREEGEGNGEGMFCKNRKTTGSPDGKEERGEELTRWREEIEMVMREGMKSWIEEMRKEFREMEGRWREEREELRDYIQGLEKRVAELEKERKG